MPNAATRRLVARVPYSRVRYNRSAARYIDASGRFIDAQGLRAIIDADCDATRERMQSHARTVQSAARAFRDGQISEGDYSAMVVVWREKQAREVKAIHLANLAAARGGFHALEASDYLRAAREIKTQYGYLNNRTSVVASDPDYAASDAFLQHAMLYADAARGTFESARLDEEKGVGLNFERNVLEAGVHHCQPRDGIESCPQQSEKGVVPTGTLILPTKRACNVKCRCKIERFKTLAEATP